MCEFSGLAKANALVDVGAPALGIDRINSGAIGATQRVGAAAVVGGVASKLAGGSFSTSDKLGAFSRWFN